ncbi:hypothetical protein [Dysosmobacter sp.]|uniref:hypothetical protein n=1 Tax=Dysosmobacter sp. TaxID=2591382 RepID=UPI002A8CB92C|nr:hypothetical protein [Dysosmobacter sp.]MDY3281716.1 hypothetical protein [Dysosmobacter sp.]
MSQKPNKKVKKEVQKQNESMGTAMWFLCVGCLAELYLLMLRRFFINGTLQQVVAWDGYLPVFRIAGLVLLAAGVVLTAMKRKENSWKRRTGVALTVFGAFLAVASWLVHHYMLTALSPLSFVVPAVMVLGILLCLYDREFGCSLVVLSLTVLVLWLCRKGVSGSPYRTMVLAAAVVYLILLAAAAYLFRKAGQDRGMVGKYRVMSPSGKAAPMLFACGLSAAAVAVGVCSSAVAYYAMWAVGLVIFVLAVYYTVRQL